MKTLLAVLALLVAAPTLAQNAVCLADPSGSCNRVTVDSQYSVRVSLDHVNRFSCTLVGLAASLTECQALAAGRTYYVTDIVVQTTTATAGSYAIQTGTGTNCGSSTTPLFPGGNTANRYLAPINTQATAVISPTQPYVATTGHAICVIGTATNTINVQISGWYSP